MKSSFLFFGGCMSVVSVDEEAHAVLPTSTTAPAATATTDNNDASEETALVDGPRRRSSSLEAWLHKTLRKQEDPQAEAARAVRRAKRKAFFRKLLGRTMSDDLEDTTATRHSVAVDLSRMEPSSETASYRLNDIYYASIASILDQYKSDDACEKEANPAHDSDKEDDEEEEEEEEEDGDEDDDVESTTDMSEVSVFDLQEDQDFYEDDEGDTATESEDDEGSALTAIPEMEVVIKPVTRPSPPAYVSPPVHIPMEYTLQDRRGGTLVAGHTVLFTSTGFKRKQRQLRYTMRSIYENAQFLEHASTARDSEDDAVELSTVGINSDWV